MQFAGACVTHAHPPEENFLFELTVNVAHTVRAKWILPSREDCAIFSSVCGTREVKGKLFL